MAGVGDFAAARSEWEALEGRWPGDPEALLPAWLGRADLLLKEGEARQAKNLAQQALETAQDPGYRQRAIDVLDRIEPGSSSP